MPQVVVRGMLGHASGATTSIYVHAKETLTAEETAKYFGKKGDTDDPE
jgi:site-specific recombinase XerD